MGYYKIKQIDSFLCIPTGVRIMELLIGMDNDSAFRLGLSKLANELIKRGISPSLIQTSMETVIIALEDEVNASAIELNSMHIRDIAGIRADIKCNDATFEVFCSIFNINSFTRTMDGFKIITKTNTSIHELNKTAGERIAADSSSGMYPITLSYSKMNRLNARSVQHMTYGNSSIIYRECIDPTMPEYRNILIDVNEDKEINIKLVDIDWD